MATNLKLIAGTLPTACYPSDPQSLYNSMFELGAAQLNDITGIIISDSQPAATDRDKGWIKTSGGAPTAPSVVFVWYNGMWVAAHPVPPSSNAYQLWAGVSGDITTYDGGEAGAVGPASGPMWEIVTAVAGRFLVAPGTIPGTSPARTIAVGGTTDDVAGAGVYLKTLARAELPAERLKLFTNEIAGESVDVPDATDTIAYRRLADSEAQSYNLAPSPGSLSNPTIGVTDALGSGTGYVQAPPFYGLYVIRRTARIYFTG